MSSSTFKSIIEHLSPGAQSYRMQRDGTLSVIDRRGRHAYFLPMEVEQARSSLDRARKRKRNASAKKARAGKTTRRSTSTRT